MHGLVLAVCVLVASTVGAQVSITEPIFHGILTVNPGRGKLDLETGNGILKASRWQFDLYPDTNGIFPDQEPLLLSIGEENFRLAAGKLTTRNQRVYSYVAKPAPERGIRMLRLMRHTDGSWGVRFVLQGIDLSAMFVNDPVCRPLALIVGDDDFFNGVKLTRKSVSSRRVRIPSDCDVGGGWPWIR